MAHDSRVDIGRRTRTQNGRWRRTSVRLRPAGAFAKFQTSPLHRRHTMHYRMSNPLTEGLRLSVGEAGRAEGRRGGQSIELRRRTRLPSKDFWRNALTGWNDDR